MPRDHVESPAGRCFAELIQLALWLKFLQTMTINRIFIFFYRFMNEAGGNWNVLHVALERTLMRKSFKQFFNKLTWLLHRERACESKSGWCQIECQRVDSSLADGFNFIPRDNHFLMTRVQSREINRLMTRRFKIYGNSWASPVERAKNIKIKSGHLKFLSNEKQFRKRIKMLKSPEMLILASHR